MLPGISERTAQKIVEFRNENGKFRGLVHISELSNRYIRDANEVVKVGQIVKVQVVSADTKTKRIALSMKSQQAAPAPPKPKPSVDDLATRRKMR